MRLYTHTSFTSLRSSGTSHLSISTHELFEFWLCSSLSSAAVQPDSSWRIAAGLDFGSLPTAAIRETSWLVAWPSRARPGQGRRPRSTECSGSIDLEKWDLLGDWAVLPGGGTAAVGVGTSATVETAAGATTGGGSNALGLRTRLLSSAVSRVTLLAMWSLCSLPSFGDASEGEAGRSPKARAAIALASIRFMPAG